MVLISSIRFRDANSYRVQIALTLLERMTFRIPYKTTWIAALSNCKMGIYVAPSTADLQG